MKFNPRGVCFLAAVALAILKVAGVISWPWAVVAIALLGWGYPYVIVLAGIIGHIGLGVIAVLFTICLMIGGGISDWFTERARRKRRAAELAAGAERGAWDR